MLTDTFKRQHNYLRISLTDNCNLRCFYCMPDEEISCATREQLMSPTEIETLARIFVSLGVNKIRLTGGEPLVRKEAAEIIERIAKLPIELTLTTNALRLHEFLPQIKAAGIRSLNVSLDTLNPATFKFITRREGFDRVMSNIKLLINEGIHAKVNVVVMRGVNDNEILDFIMWTIDEPVHVRFIEFMPFDGNQWQNEKVFPLDEILKVVASKHQFIPLVKDHNATARKFFIPGSKGSFAVISTMSHPFCEDCNRLRLTADGKMKNCLFSTGEVDLLKALRSGEDVESLIHQNLQEKKEKLGGQFDENYDRIKIDSIHNRSMIKIGG